MRETGTGPRAPHYARARFARRGTASARTCFVRTNRLVQRFVHDFARHRCCVAPSLCPSASKHVVQRVRPGSAWVLQSHTQQGFQADAARMA
ncbi:protein of unknown function (plasmid) [Caballeronia sp. S22]